jgi:CRP/FNR family transcriptional regulator, polysaccharide utilization system transcription regulator
MHYNNQYIELCLEGQTSIFKGLNQKEKDTIAQHHTLTVIKKGGFLFKEGEKSRGLICLASGKVKVFKEGVGGREQILKMVKQQGLIGYSALFSESSWSLSASAIEDSIICIFEKNSLIRIFKKNADFTLKLVKSISEELTFSNNRTVSLSQKHIRARLAESLLILRDTYGYEADGKTINISLSREDIAHLSNMTTSNAIRTLSNMAADRIIEIKGRKISILDNTNLEHISSLG